MSENHHSDTSMLTRAEVPTALEPIWLPMVVTVRVYSGLVRFTLAFTIWKAHMVVAIMESGNAVGPPWNGTEWHQPMYDRIVNKTGYSQSHLTLKSMLTIQLLDIPGYAAVSTRSPVRVLVRRGIRGSGMVRRHRWVLHQGVPSDQLH